MSHKVVSLVLMSVWLSLALVTPASAEQQAQQVARMKQTAQKAMEKDREITVVLKLQRNGNTKFTGKVKQISDEGLTLTDLNKGEQKVTFDEIQEIRGKHSHMGLIVGLAVVAGVVIVVLVTLNSLGKNS